MKATALFALILAIGAVSPAHAQDPFEIQVYEYVTVPKGRWNLETHLNHTAKGALKGQTNLTFELTRGITEMFELAGYIVTAKREGVGPEMVGWRVRPRFRLPEDLLPVKLSLALEAGFPKDAYDANDVTLEVRPVIEKGWGRVLLDLNPVIGRALRGPDAAEGWDFEPGARLGYTLNPKTDLSLEYYGSTGLVHDPLPSAQQVHMFFPGADINLSENVVWNLGVGFGATDVGNTLVYKMRLGWMF
ncbi:MAG TPA: hypothetical protein VFO55_12680 [Gemmatimonadaceae bacterium]|nr:hypothetical protein [Gemmatimonadaceae bacterium]